MGAQDPLAFGPFPRVALAFEKVQSRPTAAGSRRTSSFTERGEIIRGDNHLNLFEEAGVPMSGAAAASSAANNINNIFIARSLLLLIFSGGNLSY